MSTEEINTIFLDYFPTIPYVLGRLIELPNTFPPCLYVPVRIKKGQIAFINFYSFIRYQVGYFPAALFRVRTQIYAGKYSREFLHICVFPSLLFPFSTYSTHLFIITRTFKGPIMLLNLDLEVYNSFLNVSLSTSFSCMLHTWAKRMK